MVLDKVLGNIEEIYGFTGTIENLYLSWDELKRRRLRKHTDLGNEVGLNFDIPRLIRNGDIVYKSQERMIVVRFEETDVIVVRPLGLKQMGEICYMLGNRHLAVEINNEEVLVPYEAANWELLLGTNLDISREKRILDRGLQSSRRHHHE